MHFDSATATLEPQKLVIARTVGMENILLVSGRLVIFFLCTFLRVTQYLLLFPFMELTCQQQFCLPIIPFSNYSLKR